MVKHDDYMTPFSAWKDVSAYITRRCFVIVFCVIRVATGCQSSETRRDSTSRHSCPNRRRHMNSFSSLYS